MTAIKTTLTILASMSLGVLLGAVLGFGIPFGIATIQPSQEAALSFMPILSVPFGAILGGCVGITLGIVRSRTA